MIVKAAAIDVPAAMVSNGTEAVLVLQERLVPGPLAALVGDLIADSGCQQGQQKAAPTPEGEDGGDPKR